MDQTWISNARRSIVGIDTLVPLCNGKWTKAINFDNAATTPPFHFVMQTIQDFAPWYSSIHRGFGYKSYLSSSFFENSRKVISEFVNANPNKDSVIFVKNSTEAINKLSYCLCENKKDSIVLSSSMEHHSNDLPWRNKYKVEYIQTDPYGKLSLENLEKKLIQYKDRISLVTITGASNVTGYVNPIHKIASLAHEYNTKVLVDGAQFVPHAKINMNPKNIKEHIDFLVFSAHKMYAPFGVGVLIGETDYLKKGTSDHVGGGTVKMVTPDFVIWDDPPHKEEAGSPNVLGVAALIAAIQTLCFLDMKKIEEHELGLFKYAYYKMKQIPDLQIYCDFKETEQKIAIIPFNIKDIYHEIVSKALSYEAGISVRSGCFCAQPYIQKLLNISSKEITSHMKHLDSPHPGMVRISFGLYNTYEEIDILLEMLKKISHNKSFYIKKYQDLSFLE